MKQKLLALAKPLVGACLAFSWWVGCDGISLIFLGEYPFPTEEE